MKNICDRNLLGLVGLVIIFVVAMSPIFFPVLKVVVVFLVVSAEKYREKA